MIDDGGNAPGQLAVLIGKVIFGLTEVECGILVLRQREHIIAEKVGNVVWTTLIEVVVKVYECLKIFFCLYFLNAYCRHLYCYVIPL